MMYFLWSLPALTVIGAIASGRVNTTIAAVLGLAVTIPVALFSAPAPFTGAQLALALERGLWIGWIITPYILGGLLFWQMASQGRPAPDQTSGPGHAALGDPLARRRLLFFACFLIGPFAESATGFGVGMLGTVLLIRPLGLKPREIMVFALLSQTLIPWGAMGSGTLLASAYARVPAAQLALYSMVAVALLMGVWMVLFWRTASRAGLRASATEHRREAGWMLASLALLSGATALLGPETALLAAYGPLIVLRFLHDRRPGRPQALEAARRALPYILVIACLVATRLLPGLNRWLAGLADIRPFTDLPGWMPFLHAGSWLIAGALAMAAWQRRRGVLGAQARAAWMTGRHAVLSVFLFAMMAEALAGAGISQAYADGLFSSLRDWTILITPVLAGAFGILANSGNAPNSLFMPSQLSLAIQAGLNVPAAAALLHVSGTSMGIFSPVRMSIAAGLAHGRGQERSVYVLLLPFALAAFGILLSLALLVVMSG
jgi:lactate permease